MFKPKTKKLEEYITLSKNSLLSEEEALTIVKKIKKMIKNESSGNIHERLDQLIDMLIKNANCSLFFIWILENLFEKWGYWDYYINSGFIETKFANKLIDHIKRTKNPNHIPFLFKLFDICHSKSMRENISTTIFYIKKQNKE